MPSCDLKLLGGALVGTVLAAVGAASSRCSMLRAQSEWRAHPAGRTLDGRVGRATGGAAAQRDRDPAERLRVRDARRRGRRARRASRRNCAEPVAGLHELARVAEQRLDLALERGGDVDPRVRLERAREVHRARPSARRAPRRAARGSSAGCPAAGATASSVAQPVIAVVAVVEVAVAEEHRGRVGAAHDVGPDRAHAAHELEPQRAVVGELAVGVVEVMRARDAEHARRGRGLLDAELRQRVEVGVGIVGALVAAGRDERRAPRRPRRPSGRACRPPRSRDRRGARRSRARAPGSSSSTTSGGSQLVERGDRARRCRRRRRPCA